MCRALHLIELVLHELEVQLDHVVILETLKVVGDGGHVDVQRQQPLLVVVAGVVQPDLLLAQPVALGRHAPKHVAHVHRVWRHAHHLAHRKTVVLGQTNIKDCMAKNKVATH
jgi:hypothetical protein